MTMEVYLDAVDTLQKEWGRDGSLVIEACEREDALDMDIQEFLQNCVACGGNWGAMFLSGIKHLYPNVYDVIPQNMGKNAFICLCYVLRLLNVDWKE